MSGSLKSKLIILFTLFACVPVLIGTGINAYFSMSEMKTTTITSNLNLNKEIANEIKLLMDKIRKDKKIEDIGYLPK